MASNDTYHGVALSMTLWYFVSLVLSDQVDRYCLVRHIDLVDVEYIYFSARKSAHVNASTEDLLPAFLVNVATVVRVSGLIATRSTICKLMHRETAQLCDRARTPNTPSTIYIPSTLPNCLNKPLQLYPLSVMFSRKISWLMYTHAAQHR